MQRHTALTSHLLKRHFRAGLLCLTTACGIAFAQLPAPVLPSNLTSPPTGATAITAGNGVFKTAVVPALKLLPLPACNGVSWSSMVDGMSDGLAPLGSNWYVSQGACGVKAFVFNPAAAVNRFGVWIVRDGVTRLSDMPLAQGDEWSSLGDASFAKTVFSYATEDMQFLEVANPSLPGPFREIFATGAYQGLTHLRVPQGAQLFSQAAIQGALGDLLSGPINLPTNNLWLRLEMAAKRYELLLPPGQAFSGPLGMTAVSLNGVTVAIDQARNLAVMGNATFQRMPGKILPMVIDSPARVPGTWPRNWPASQIALNAPRTLGLNDYVNLIADLSTQPAQAASQVGFINDIVPSEALMTRLMQLSAPLGTFKLINPDPNADTFRLAAGSAYPDLKQFNFVLLGSQARAKDGSNTPGPLLRFKGDVEVFSQRLARSDTLVSKTAFQTNSSGGFNIGLQSIGITNPSVDAVVDIGTSPTRANIALQVKSPVRNFQYIFNETRISANSPANCALPVNLAANINISGATAQSLVSGLTPSPPSPQLAIDCANVVGDLVAKGAEQAVAAGTVAVNAVAGAASGAANAAYSAAASFVNNPGKALTNLGDSLSGSRNVCNQRIEWLRERGNRPDPDQVADMINRIYQPMRANADAARRYADWVGMHAQYLSNAHEAYRSIEQYWNAHPLKSSALPAYPSFHPSTNVFDYAGRVQAMRARATFLDSGGTQFQNLLDWRTYAGFETNLPGAWRGRNEAEWIWARCAAAWVADIPIRTAETWGIPFPKHQGRYPDAMFMGRPDYLKVRSDVAQRVAAEGGATQADMAWVNGFTQQWTLASRNFYVALLGKAIEGVPLQAGEQGSAQSRYNAAANRLKDEAVEIMRLEARVHACQVMRTIDNLLRAKEEVKTGRKPTIGPVRPAQCGPANYPRGPMNEQLFSVFDPLWYLGNHPDVRQVFGNTIVGAQTHWLRHGLIEGRSASWNFHAPTYARLNPDLPAGYGATNWQGMTFHWIQAGLREGRQTTPWLDP